jgi:hypothetical protein
MYTLFDVNTGSNKRSKTKGKTNEDNIDNGLMESDYIDPIYHRRVPWLHIDITHGTIDDSVIGVEHPSVWVRFRRLLAKRSKQKDFDEELQEDDEVPEVCDRYSATTDLCILRKNCSTVVLLCDVFKYVMHDSTHIHHVALHSICECFTNKLTLCV